MALVALLHLSDCQVWMQPVKFFWLQVLQQETVASCVLDVWPQSTADQNRTNNGLKQKGEWATLKLLSQTFSPTFIALCGYTGFFFSTGDNMLNFYFWLLLHTQRGNMSSCALLKNLSSSLDVTDAKLNTSLAQIQNTTFKSVVSLSQPSDTSPPFPPPKIFLRWLSP